MVYNSDDEFSYVHDDGYTPIPSFRRNRKPKQEEGSPSTTYEERKQNYEARKQQENDDFEKSYFEETTFNDDDDGLTPDQKKEMEEEINRMKHTGQDIPLFSDANLNDLFNNEHNVKFHEHYMTTSDNFDDYVEEFIYQNFLPKEIHHCSFNEILSTDEFARSQFHDNKFNEEKINEFEENMKNKAIPTLTQTTNYIKYKQEFVKKSFNEDYSFNYLEPNDKLVFDELNNKIPWKDYFDQDKLVHQYRFIYTEDLRYFRNVNHKHKSKFIILTDLLSIDDVEHDSIKMLLSKYNQKRLRSNLYNYLLIKHKVKLKNKYIIVEHPAYIFYKFRNYFNEIVIHREEKQDFICYEEAEKFFLLHCNTHKFMCNINSRDHIYTQIFNIFNVYFKNLIDKYNLRSFTSMGSNLFFYYDKENVP